MRWSPNVVSSHSCISINVKQHSTVLSTFQKLDIVYASVRRNGPWQWKPLIFSLRLYSISPFLPAQHVIWDHKFSFTHSNQFCLAELPGLDGACLSTCLLRHTAPYSLTLCKKPFSIIKNISDSRPGQSNNGQTSRCDLQSANCVTAREVVCMEWVLQKGQRIKEIPLIFNSLRRWSTSQFLLYQFYSFK